MITYKIINTFSGAFCHLSKLVDGVEATIVHISEADKDWQKYQAWVKAGNVPLPADQFPSLVLVRDLAKEIDELKAKVAELEKKVK